MATPITFNGTSYSVPSRGDSLWSNLSLYLIAISTETLQKIGGAFTLLSDVDFGAAGGVKAKMFSSRNTPSTTGIFRAGNNESIAWRNAGNSADLALKVNSSNILEFNGAPLVTLALGAADTGLKMNSGGTAYEWGKFANANIDNAAAIAYSKLNLAASIVNADVSNSAAIAYSKLSLTGGIVNADVNASAAIAVSKLAALTASRALVSDGSGFVSASSVTSTELGYVAGVTSAIQTQLDTKITASSTNTLTNKTFDVDGTGNSLSNVANANIKSAAAIALNKLAATTASRALVSDGSGFVSASSVTSTELGYVSGVTSSIQTQLNSALLNPMTTAEDIIFGGVSGLPTRKAIGAANTVLRSSGSQVLGYALIVDANIDSAAAITGSKVNLATSSVRGTVDPYSTNGVVYSGTYTPTASNLSNLSGGTVRQHNFIRVGSMVSVSGVIDGLTTTTSGTDVSLQITLPVATSNFSDSYQASGACSYVRDTGGIKEAGVCFSSSGNQRVGFQIQSTSAASSGGNCAFYYSFIYQIQ